VSQTSLFAAMLEMCGIPVPGGVEGEPPARFVREPHGKREGPAFSGYALHAGNARYMIRHGGWKTSYYVSDSAGLYSLRGDAKRDEEPRWRSEPSKRKRK